MRVCVIYTLFFLSCLFDFICGRRDGAPLNSIVCSTLEPIGHIAAGAGILQQPLTNIPDFTIDTGGRSYFFPEETIDISLHSLTDQVFKGVLLQVRDENSVPSGRFVRLDENNYKMYNCHEMFSIASVNSTVTHSNNDSKEIGQFHWRAPENCSGSTYEIRATVVIDVANYQSGLVARVSCLSNGTENIRDPSTELIYGEPTQEASTCQSTSETSVPARKYQTSFERAEHRGWNLTGWYVNQGNTPSRGTGPHFAAHGRRYAYFETSFPVRPLTKATIESDRDLSGCFCLKLSHHHNVDEGRNHVLTIMAGDDVLYKTEERQPYWQDLSLQVDTDERIKIKIIGTRGDNFRGDMAIDNIRIIKGWCT